MFRIFRTSNVIKKFILYAVFIGRKEKKKKKRKPVLLAFFHLLNIDEIRNIELLKIYLFYLRINALCVTRIFFISIYSSGFINFLIALYL